MHASKQANKQTKINRIVDRWINHRIGPQARTSRASRETASLPPGLHRLSLLDREGFLGEDPAPGPPRRPLLALLDALHPPVPSLGPRLPHVLPRQQTAAAGRRTRRADVDPVAALALQRGVPGQHVEVPQRQAGRQARLLAQADGRREFEVAEVGLAFFGAHAHADEFDFRHDEAVAGVAFAQQAVQMGEAGEVERLLAVLFFAHAAVPGLVRLDEADDTATAERVGLIVGVGRNIEWAIFSVALRDHGDVMFVALAGLEGSVDFGGVECGNDVLKAAFVGGLDY